MATTSNSATRHGPLQRRRIIERPRLLALLDGSTAPIRTLVAPAGYGKTTLAEQWIARDGRVSAWFKARPSSTDVAGLALGVARASIGVVPGCDERLREHLRALPAPAENVEVLAEILGEDLATWPANAWLVIDEYEEILGAEDAERFVETLIAESPIQLLVASRRRPSWAKEKAILYGDILEIDPADLAMDAREATQVLSHRSAPSTSGLLAIAKGWPAVIGLASVTPAEIGQGNHVPEELYRYFAQEIFGAFDEDVQAGLLSLAIAPVLDRALATALLGVDLSRRVYSAALDAGVMVERAGQLELHPLARSFLEERNTHLSSLPDPAALTKCVNHYRKRHDWDASFELIARHDLRPELEALLPIALDELLETARLATVEAWCELGAAESNAPVFALAKAELALRNGRLAEAQAQGEVAAAHESALKFPALLAAGRAAHLASREEEALDLYERAVEAAASETHRREALWSRLTCLIDLEHPEATTVLEELRQGVSPSNPAEAVRSATMALGHGLKLAGLDLTEADRAYELIGMVRDPITRSSFETLYAATLALSARYDDALAVTESVFEAIRKYRLEFARPWAFKVAALAHAGRREWPAAEKCINEALAVARAGQNGYAETVCSSASMRILAQQGRFDAAMASSTSRLACSVPSARAELLGSRALVMASMSRLDEARALIEEMRGSSRLIEAKVLAHGVDALIGLKSGHPDVGDRTHVFIEAALTTGAPDLLVTTYRAAPEVLRVLLRDRSYGDDVAALVRRVGDDDLAAAVGHSLELDNPHARLSQREREVFDLVCQTMTNGQIAQLLFISESTVKVHVQHIFDKLGVRSRVAVAMQARLLGSTQATSAITGDDATGDPSLL